MSLQDKNIKQIRINLKHTKPYRTVTLQEKDKINMKYKDDSGNLETVHGYLLKIGVDPIKNKNYITLILYNYREDNNVRFIYTDQIIDIININRSKETYSFSPIYCSDESVLLLKSTGNNLQFTSDGKTWNNVSGGSGVSTDSIYNKMVEKGFTGTEDDLVDLLLNLYKEKDNIVIREIENL